MGKSRRKTPYSSNAIADSEKQDKRRANRANRRINKTLTATATEATVFEDLRETSNIANFEKDGKGYIGNLENKDYLEKLLRK